MIFEYKLAATTEEDVLAWAEAFHALGARPRSFHDLTRRNADLKAVVCPDLLAAPDVRKTRLRRGLSRVH